MNGDTPISGKSMVGESVVEASRKWVGEVFQDGLGTINTFYGENSEESFLILNTGSKIELKDIQKFLFKKRDVVANFLIASIWAIIKS